MDGFWTFLCALVWPLGLLVFFWPLRAKLTGDWPSVAELVRKVRRGKASAPGFELEFELAEQQQAAAKDLGPGETALPAEVPKISAAQSAALEPLKHDLLAQLNAFPEPQRVPILLDALGRTRLQAGHEYVYNRIFGSQIAALERLRQAGGASVTEAREFFAPYAAANKEFYDGYPFDKWAGFLVNLALVKLEGDRYRLQPFGLAFLDYVDGAKLSKAKPL